MKAREYEKKGYITVSLALILVLVISLCMALIEGCRRSTIMLVAECAIDTGMNSILAEYHRELLNQYGLFFIDTSYGTAVPDYGVTLEHLQSYVEANLSDREPVLELVTEDFLDLHWDEGEIIGLSVSADENGAVLRRQISEYMKEQIGVSYLEGVLDWLDIVENHNLTGDWYTDMKQNAETGLEQWMVDVETDSESRELTYVEDLLKNLQEQSLDLLLGTGELSDAHIAGERFLSKRELLQGSGMNPALSFSDDMTDGLFLNEYIIEKTGRYNREKTNGRLAYQTEYILCGLDSDVANISEISDRLFGLRAAADAVHIMGNEKKMNLIAETADLISAAVGLPEISVLLQVLFVVIWASTEAVWDVGQLLDGGEIPLIKSERQWHYDLDISKSNLEEENSGGLKYEDYLRIFLAFQDKKITTYRLMDVMEMDIRLTPGNDNFRMDGCVDSVTVCIDLESGYGYQFYITRNYGY